MIEVRGLRMRYGSVDVLEGVEFTARRGKVLVLLGPNGAGKTTTVEILEGSRRRSAGEVRVLGVDPAKGGEDWRARIGIVLQSWRDHGRWKVRELLAHMGRYYEPYSTLQRERPYNADKLLGSVGLRSQADARIASLSGGQRRQLDVAIGLVGRPELLFLDEPTVGFDPEARRDFHDLVHRLSDLEDTTILLTTHDLDEAEKLADRILILAGGRIVADGSADQLARQVSGQAEVRWACDGQRFVHATDDATRFVRELFAQYGNKISDLEVRRASLEDTHMTLVRELISISGIFYPITRVPEWLQWVAQLFPVYWLGLGVRSALLPDELACGDRRVLATPGDRRGSRAVGLGRSARRPSGTAQHGAAGVRRRPGVPPAEGHAARRLRTEELTATMSETVHNRIAMLRAERRISRRQLAEALGVHYQTIGYLERGEYSPSLYLALKIAEYFEVPVEVIFSTTPFPRIGSGERSALSPQTTSSVSRIREDPEAREAQTGSNRSSSPRAGERGGS